MTNLLLQAIQTKFHGPGNVQGAKVSARAGAGRKLYPWDHSKNPEDNHRLAARMFAQAFGWQGELASGVLHDGSYVHVFTERSK